MNNLDYVVCPDLFPIDGDQVRGKKVKDGQYNQYDNYQMGLKEILKEIE